MRWSKRPRRDEGRWKSVGWKRGGEEEVGKGEVFGGREKRKEKGDSK